MIHLKHFTSFLYINSTHYNLETANKIFSPDLPFTTQINQVITNGQPKTVFFLNKVCLLNGNRKILIILYSDLKSLFINF